MFHGGTDFDPGSGTFILPNSSGGSDVYIQKLDSNGLFMWAKGFGNIADDEGHCIAIDSNQMVYVIGYINSGGLLDCDPGLGVNLVDVWGWKSSFLQKLDSNGNFIWFKLFQSPTPGGSLHECIGEKITIDKNNNIYCSGTFNFDVDFESDSSSSAIMTTNSSKDIYLLRFSESGNLNWKDKLGGSKDDYIFGLTCDKNSNLIASGSFDSEIQFGINPTLPNFNSILTAGFITSISQVPLSINTEYQRNNFYVYPNPTNDYLWVKDFGEGKVIIRNYLGQVILVRNSIVNEVIIDVSRFSKGLYTVQTNKGIKSILIH
jgi:hypothetical protein